MLRFVLGRILQGFIALIFISSLVFFLARVIGTPEALFLGEYSTKEDLVKVRQQLGLDRPLIIQFIDYTKDLLCGEFGNSITVSAHTPVIKLIGQRVLNSVKLACVGVVFAMVVSIPLAIMAAARQGSLFDKFVRIIAAVGQSVPIFLVGILLIELFSVQMRVLPSFGMGSWKHYLMPGFCMGIFLIAGITRLLRSSMLDALESEYIKLARIKGVSERVIIWKHAFRNSMLSPLSFVSVYVAILVTSAIVIEVVFAWPGLGRLAYEGIVKLDFLVVQGVVITGAALIIIANFVGEILYGYLDPRIKYNK